VSDGDPAPDRFELAVLLAVYVVPLLATVGFLAWVGLPGLALALLAVEAGVSAAVVRAKRPEGAHAGPAVFVLAAGAVLAGLSAVLLLVRPGTGG
jgi:hypothetical protein